MQVITMINIINSNYVFGLNLYFKWILENDSRIKDIQNINDSSCAIDHGYIILI